MNMNPFMAALQMAQAGKNPLGMMQKLLGGNPQMIQAMNLIKGKSMDELRTTAENMAKERGVSLEQLAQSMGVNLPH